MARLTGKRIFATAAGQGIGRATVENFIKEGAEVIATDVDITKLEGLNAADHIALDVLDKQAIRDIAAKIGPVDGLFNCAGFVHHGAILTTSDDDWDFSFNLNVTAMHQVTKAFLPKMIENGGGAIVNMASVVSSIKAAPNRYVYATTKAAIIGMTRSIALDYISKNIRINAICPGTIVSPSLEMRIADLGKNVGGTETARKMFIERQPMGRLGEAEEVAALATFLMSEESAFITGRNMVIDGGMSL